MKRLGLVVLWLTFGTSALRLSDSVLDLHLTDEQLLQLSLHPNQAAIDDCVAQDLDLAQRGFNMQLNMPQNLNFLNATTLWGMIGAFIKDADSLVTVCQARQMFYDTLRTEYDSCMDPSYLINSGGAPVNTAMLYVHMMRHLEFMCGGGFGVYTDDMDCFLKNDNDPSLDPCFQTFNQTIHQDYNQLCPAVNTYMNCMNDGYVKLCGNVAGWTMCEYERVGYAWNCPGLRCYLTQN
ncbi:unnamed protein product, partial [Mesorhabditis belari]|uniref:Uncharacterized protein n=1 Tax=Mesorhabditis belari TaxID=2138241 RepID=A0AAF3EBQ9_9BILA